MFVRDADINFSKSKKKRRIVRKSSILDTILSYLYFLFLCFTFIILSLTYFFKEMSKGDDILPYFYFTLSLIPSIFFLYSVYQMDRLTKVQGLGIEQNKSIIKEVALQLGFDAPIHNNNISILSPPWDSFSTNWGRQVFVIYDHADILINVAAYGLHDLKSPFHFIGNRMMQKTVIARFEKEVRQYQINDH